MLDPIFYVTFPIVYVLKPGFCRVIAILLQFIDEGNWRKYFYK